MENTKYKEKFKQDIVSLYKALPKYVKNTE